MRLQLLLASFVGCLLAAGVAHAQTEEIQQEVEVNLWIHRMFDRIEAVTGATPLVLVLTLLTLVLALVASLWLWRASRKRED
jgi:hypothetical protein